MIINITKYSLTLYKKLNQHLFWTTQFKMSVLAIIPIIITGIALLLLNEMTLFYITLGIVGLLLLGTFAVLVIQNSSITRASVKYPNKQLHYHFNGTEFKVIVKTEDTKLEEVIKYKDIKKIKTNKKYMFIYLSKTDLYVVDKRGFESADDYRGLLDLFKDLFLV